MMCCDKILT